jgi:hypothetical protein
MQQRADDHDAHGEIVFRADGLGLYARRAGAHVFEAGASAPKMVGSVLIRVMSPAAATAPAPMGLM